MSITEHISHPVIHALGMTVLHSLWQIGIIALIWRGIMYIARKNHPGFRYNISLVALLAIPATFVIAFFRQWNIYTNARRIVSVEFDAIAWIAGSGDRAFYLIERRHTPFMEHLDVYMPVVFWLYIAGILVFSLFTFFSYSKLQRLKKQHSVPLPADWQRKIPGLLHRTGIQRSVPVLYSARITIPMVAGFLKPAVLLPAAVLFSMTTEQIETILLHELYHIRRNDHYINMAQSLLEIVFFYHPAVWWMSKNLRRDREACVDDWVVRETGKPLLYAQALVTIESNRGTSMMQPMLAATQSKNHLFTRIKHMMTMKTRSMTFGQRIAAVAALVFALGSVAWISPAMTTNMFTPEGNNMLPPLGMYEYNYLESQTAPYVEEEGIPGKPAEKTGYTPHTIHLHDGSTLEIEGLSEKDVEEIRAALGEVRMAMHEVNKEVLTYLRSEEFRMQMQEAEKAGEEIRKAMEELRKSMEDEEFKQEMRNAREQVKQAMRELDAVDWKAIGREVDAAMREVSAAMEKTGKSLENIGPVINEVMQEVERGLKVLGDGFMKELGPAIQEMLQSVQESLEKAADTMDAEGKENREEPEGE